MKTGRGWAGMFKDGRICNWAEPFANMVTKDDNFIPGKGDKVIRVRILKESDYRKLVKVANLYEKVAAECTEKMRMSCQETAPIRESIKVFDKLVKNQKEQAK